MLCNLKVSKIKKRGGKSENERSKSINKKFDEALAQNSASEGKKQPVLKIFFGFFETF